MMGVAILWRCSYHEVVYIMKVYILCRCSYYGGVHDMLVSTAVSTKVVTQ